MIHVWFSKISNWLLIKMWQLLVCTWQEVRTVEVKWGVLEREGKVWLEHKGYIPLNVARLSTLIFCFVFG